MIWSSGSNGRRIRPPTRTPWRATSRHYAPWYVVPADHKWFAQALVSDVVVDALEQLDLSTPKLSAEKRRDLAKARRLLSRA